MSGKKVVAQLSRNETWQEEFPTEDQSEQLAQLLWNLLVPQGVEYAQAQRWNYRKGNPGSSITLTHEDFVPHVLGGKYWLLRPNQGGLCAWLAVDVDQEINENTQLPGIPLEKVADVADILKRRGYPFLLNFSGLRGCHFTIPLSHPVSELEHARLLAPLISATGDLSDLIPYAGQFISTPCGRHPLTRRRTGFLDPYTFEPIGVERELALIQGCDKLPVGRQFSIGQIGNGAVSGDTEAAGGVIPDSFPYRLPPLPKVHRYKECLNVLWTEGVLQKGRRHSATCAIIAAVKTNKQIPGNLCWPYVEDWVRRTYPRWMQRRATNKTLEQAIAEAMRLMDEVKSFAPNCDKSFYRDAMSQACRPEFSVKCTSEWVSRLHEQPHWTQVLDKWRGWRKLGRGKRDIYEAMVSLADGGRTYDGMPIVQQAQTTIAACSNVHPNTVGDALPEFVKLGLLVPVPEEAVNPLRTGPGRPIVAYALPEVTEWFLQQITQRALFKGLTGVCAESAA